MTTIAHTPVSFAPAPKAKAEGKGFFARLYDAMIEARMRAAEREVRRIKALHGYDELEKAELAKLDAGKAAAKLPFAA